MTVEQKLFSLGFIYNGKENIFQKRTLNPSLIPEDCFVKSIETGVELYAQNKENEDLFDHIILSIDYTEILLDETVTKTSILEK